jgi:hypothetical protein
VISRKTTTLVVALVSSVWAVNFLAGVVLPNYEADQAINGIFMAIVGGTLALGRTRDKDGGDPK